MIDFTGKTFSGIFRSMLDKISNAFDKRDTAPIPTALGPAAYMMEDFYLALDKVQRSAYVQTAQGEDLDMLAIIGSVKRNPESAAVRVGEFNIQIPIGSRFSNINGDRSINYSATEYIGQEGGAHRYKLIAETKGEIGNEYFGSILPITVIPGLNSATIGDILVPGEDIEDDESLRARLIESLLQDAFAGNVQSYRSHCLGIEGVGAVQVYPNGITSPDNPTGAGTVALSIMDGNYMPASRQLIEQIQSDIDPEVNQGAGIGFAPIGATVMVMAPTAVAINVRATVRLAAGKQLGQIEPLIIESIEKYLESIRKGWDTNVSASSVAYSADVYTAVITSAIVNTEGVINASNVQIGKDSGAYGTSDIILEQSGSVQFVPVKGSVVISE